MWGIFMGVRSMRLRAHGRYIESALRNSYCKRLQHRFFLELRVKGFE